MTCPDCKGKGFVVLFSSCSPCSCQNREEQKEKREPELVVKSSGSKHWYLNGKLHREDGPAIEYADGSKHWYLNGKLHRIDGPAATWPNGCYTWYLDNQIHRVGGPAMRTTSGLHWYQHGQRHREDGPAIEWFDGKKEWFLNNRKITKQQYAEVMAKRDHES